VVGPCEHGNEPSGFTEGGDFFDCLNDYRSRDSSVVERWDMSWMIGGLSPGKAWEFFSSPPQPYRPWGPPSLLQLGTRGSFPGGEAARA
jgi:hypothetical protein